jgi:hypothetical protein
MMKLFERRQGALRDGLHKQFVQPACSMRQALKVAPFVW